MPSIRPSVRSVTEAGVAGLPILDHDALAALEALLPRADLQGNLRLLIEACEHLRLRLDGAAHDAHSAAAAHTLAGSGGLLGFVRLSAAARRYERAVETGAVDRHAQGLLLQGVLDATLPAMRGAAQAA